MKKYKYTGLLARKRQPFVFVAENTQVGKALRIADNVQTEALIRELFADCDAGSYDANMDKGLGAAQSQLGWRRVAMTLAERYVPGFQYGRNKGRPKKPFSADDAELIMEMTKVLQKQRQPSIRAAAVSVAKKLGKKAGGVDRRYRRLMKDRGIN